VDPRMDLPGYKPMPFNLEEEEAEEVIIIFEFY
jgi:hypothetical protein